MLFRSTAISVDLSSMEETRAKLPTVFSRLVRNRDGLFVGTESGDTVHLLTIEGQVQKVLYRVPGAPSLDAVPAPDGTTYIFPGGSMPTPLSPRSLLALSASGELEWQSEASDDLIKRVVVDPVTAQVAVSRSNGMVLVYDKRHRLLWQQQVGQAEAKDLAFVEGLLIIPQENGLLAALDAETGAPRYLAVAAATEINRVVSSGDGKSLFLAASDGSVRKVDTVTGSVTFAHHGHDGRVTVLAVIGDQVLSGGQDGTIRKWDARIPFAQRLTDEPITLLRATREGFFAVTASSLIHVAADGGVSRRPRPPSDPHSALYAAWEAPGSKHHYFFKSDGLEVFEGDTLRWSAPGVMTFVAIDPETGRVVYGTDGSKVHLVNVVTDGGAPTEIAAFDSNNDMMLLGRFVLTNNGRDLLSVDLSDPQLTVKTAPAHRGVFNFSLTGRPDFFLTYGIRGNGQLLGWSASDLSRPAFRIDQVPSDVLAADLSDDGSTVSAVLGDGSLSFFDTQHEVMLSKSSLAQLADAAAINLALGSVAFQDAKGRLMRASLPRVPAFADDATLDAFMRARVPLELDGEKLVRRGH